MEHVVFTSANILGAKGKASGDPIAGFLEGGRGNRHRSAKMPGFSGKTAAQAVAPGRVGALVRRGEEVRNISFLRKCHLLLHYSLESQRRQML